MGPRGLTDAFKAKYELVQELGHGGMGTVYRGRDLRLERDVAIKFLISEDAESRARFAREAKTLARVQHANVTMVFEVGDDGGVPYLVSELVDGESLAAFLGRAGKLSEGDAARLGAAVARGLAAVHAIGVIHRDLKPANVLMARDGTPKICDFGLARSEQDDAVTRTGMIAGTPEYLAPELIRGGRAGAPCDIYALGCLLHEMLSGAVPFAARDASGVTRPLLDLLNAHAHEEPPGLPQSVSQATAKLVMACLAKDPAARPSAEQVCEQLGGVAPALRSGVSSRANRSSGRIRVASAPARTVIAVAAPPAGTDPRMIAVACVTALALGAGAWFMMRKPAVPPPVAPVASASATPAPPSIDTSDPAHALATLELRLKMNPRVLSAPDAAVAQALPAPLFKPARERVRAMDNVRTQPIPPAIADQVALALLLVRPDDRQLALEAVARLLATAPRRDERLLLEMVARHAADGPARLAKLLSGVKLAREVAPLLPESRIVAMQARAELLAGRRDEALKIVTGANFEDSVLLAELKLELGLPIVPGARFRWDAGGQEMVYVPPGPFWMGDGPEGAKSDHAPRHQVRLSGYFIDRYETTIGEYLPFYEWVKRTRDHRRCGDGPCAGRTGDALGHPAGTDLTEMREIAEGKAGAISDVLGQFHGHIKDRHPVTGVDWFDSAAYAAWTGRQLPTEAQWEKAARGPDGRPFPWGKDVPIDGFHAQFDRKERDLSRVDKRSNGQSPYGCYDMSGNAEEWVNDWYHERAYDAHQADGAIDPVGPVAGTDRVKRGGSNTGDTKQMLTYHRADGPPWKTKHNAWGFRCAYSVAAGAPVTARR